MIGLSKESMILNFSWFSGRIHLDKNYKVIIPTNIEISSIKKEYSIDTVIQALKKCERDLIY